MNCAGAPLILGVQRGILAGRQAAGVGTRGKTVRLWERLTSDSFNVLASGRIDLDAGSVALEAVHNMSFGTTGQKDRHNRFICALVQKFSIQGEKAFDGFFSLSSRASMTQYIIWSCELITMSLNMDH